MKEETNASEKKMIAFLERIIPYVANVETTPFRVWRSRASKSPTQTSAFKPRYTQGLFDFATTPMPSSYFPYLLGRMARSYSGTLERIDHDKSEHIGTRGG